MPQTGKKKVVEPAPQGAGLKMAAHPLLLDTSAPVPQSNKDKYKPMQPKFASIKVSVFSAASFDFTFSYKNFRPMFVMFRARRLLPHHRLP